MTHTTVEVDTKEFEGMIKDFDILKQKLENLDHLFAVKSYEQSKGKLQGLSAKEFLNDL